MADKPEILEACLSFFFSWPKFVQRNEVMFWAGHVEEVFVFALYSGHLGDFTMENLRLEGKSSHSLLRAVRFVIAAMLAAVFFFFNALQVRNTFPDSW